MASGRHPTLLGTIGLLLATLLGATALAAVTLLLFPDWPQIVQMAVPTEIALTGAVVWCVMRSGKPWREALGLDRLRGETIGPLMLILIGSVTVFSELYIVIQRVVPVPEAYERMLRDLMRIDGTADLVATVAVAVVLAPILEEALFRGALLRGLTRARGPRAATLWTAVFFALYHLYNPWQVVPTFFLGLVLAWVVLSTRTLLAGIVVHACFNAVSLGIFAAPFTRRDPAAGQVPWVVAAIFVALLLASVAFLAGMAWLERVTGGGWYAAARGDGVGEGRGPEGPPEDDLYPGAAASRPGPFTARG